MAIEAVAARNFARRAKGTDVNPAWYGREITKEVATGTDVDGAPTHLITRRYTVVGITSSGGAETTIRLCSEHGRDAWCTAEYVRGQLGGKRTTMLRGTGVRALDLGLG